MALDPFRQKFGTEQGRIPPVRLNPPEGDYAFVLGHDDTGITNVFAPGDRIKIDQSASLSTDRRLLRLRARLRPPARMPHESAAEPFALSDGQTLKLKVDGGVEQTVTFNAADFVDIANARAYEVAREIRKQVTGATASAPGGTTAQAESEGSGVGSGIEVTGGTASATLGFTERKWQSVLKVEGSERFRKTLEPGETRDFVDLAANIEGGTDTKTIELFLELV